MNKNFIKKLSFVLVLAMVISVFAPASGALAAKGPSLNSKKKYLHLGREAEGTNEFDFNITGKKSGWKYAWTSANTKVAKVNAKNGVTKATGVGTTKVSVKITDKDGKKIATLPATVVVRDNIAEVAVSNPLAEGKTLTVGENYDFNRSFVTEAGSTKKTSGVTRWTVEQDGKVVDTATIDEKGNFVADEAGVYTIVARSFQSTAKYNDWVKDNTLDVVTATADTTATVVASIVEVKQVNKNSLTVEFDSDMSKTEIAKLDTIYRMVADKELVTGAEKIKKVTLSTDGKIATIELYGALIGGTTYKFKFDGLEDTFEAAKADVKAIAALQFTENPIKAVENGAGVDLLTKLEAVNSDGVVIFTGSDLKNNITFAYDDGGKYNGFAYSGMLYMYKAGAEGTVTANFSQSVYNAETISYDEVKFDATAIAIGVKLDASTIPGSTSYQLTASAADPDMTKDDGWKNNFKVAQGESVYIHSRYKVATDKDNYVKGTFNYESGNTDVAIIAANVVYFVAKGNTVILVKNADGNVVDSFTITVVEGRKLTTVTPEGALLLTIGNGKDLGVNAETKTFKFIAKDNLEQAISGVTVTSELKQFPKDAVTKAVIAGATSDADGKISLDVTAAEAVEGLYVFELTFTSVSGTITTTLKQTVSVRVVAATDNDTAVRWELDLGGEIDLNKTPTAKATAVVKGFNAAGAQVATLTATPGVDGFKLVVKKGADEQKQAGAVTGAVIDAAILKEGTYSVAVLVDEAADNTHISKRANNFPLVSGVLVIKDTTKKEVIVKSTIATPGTIAAALAETFTFKLNDVEETVITGAVIKGANGEVTFATSLVAGDYFVESVTTTNTTFTVNKGIKVK